MRGGSLWSVNISKREYYKLDKAALQAKMSGMDARMQAMRNARQKPHDFTLKDTGRHETVGAYGCEVWQAFRDGKLQSEDCVAPQGSLPGGAELVAAAHAGSAIAANIVSAIPQMQRATSSALILYGKLDGFPVRHRNIAGGRPDHEDVVTRIEQQSLPAERFEISTGFTEALLGRGGPHF